MRALAPLLLSLVVASGIGVVLPVLTADPAFAATVPLAPATAQAVPVDSGAVVSWVAANDGGSALTQYDVVASPGGATMTTAPGVLTATFSSLTNGTSYTFSVTATNALGRGAAKVTPAITPGPLSTYRAAVMADSPALYYRLDEPTASTMSVDYSGNARTGTASGGTFQQSGALANESSSKALSVSGVVVTSQAGGLPSGNSARTLETWFKSGGTDRIIGGYGASSTRAMFRAVITAAGEIQVDAYNESKLFNTPVRIANTTWHHLVMSYDGTTLTVYLDGSSIGTATFSASLVTDGTKSLTLGLNGGLQVDEVAVYPTALSATQVAAHWTASGDTRPSAVASVTTSAGANTVTATWPAASATVPAGQGAITGYRVTALTGTTVRGVVATNATATSATLKGLPAGLAYDVRVEPYNDFGVGAAATSTSTVTPTGSTTTYSSTILADTPSLYFRLGESAGGRMADSSGNGRDVLGGAATPLTGALPNDTDGALSTNTPAGTYAPTLNQPGGAGLPAGNSARTAEVWFKATTTTTTPLLYWGNTTTRAFFRLNVIGQHDLQIDVNGDTTTLVPDRPITTGWHLATATYDGTTFRIYLDGALLGSRVSPAALVTDATKYLVVGTNTVSAWIDEAAIYTYALSATQIAAHFAASGNTRPTAPGSVTATGGTNSVTASWAAATATTASGQPAVGGYRVTVLNGTTVQGATTTGNAATSVTVTGVPAGTGYTVRVEAYNEYGYGASLTSSAVTVTGAATTYASTVRADGPAAYYRLDELTGDRYADSSGSAHDVFATGTSPLTPGAIAGDAAQTAPVNAQYQPQQATGSGLPAGNTARTAEAWFKPTSAIDRTILSWGSSSTSRANFKLSWLSGRDLSVDVNGEIVTFTPDRPVMNNSWHLATATWDGTTLRIYLDGVLIGSKAMSALSTDASKALYVGAIGAPVSVDEAAVYPVALSATQVAAHFDASGHARPGAAASVTATAGANSATATWTPASDAGGYRVTALSGTTVRGAVSTGPDATSATIRGLPATGGYVLRVEAYNDYGIGPAATSSSVIPTGTTTTFASTILADAPSVYYRLSEPSGRRFADASGNGRDAIGSNGTPTAGPLLTDSDPAQSVPDSGGVYQPSSAQTSTGLPTGNSARSAEVWFDASSTTPRTFVSWGAPSGTRSWFALRFAPNGSELVVDVSNEQATVTPDRPLTGGWHHMAATYDGTTVKIYLDGKLLDTRTFSAALATSAGPLVVGNSPGTLLLDEIAVYPVALTAAQVAAHFAGSAITTPFANDISVTATGGDNSATVSWTGSGAAAVPSGQSSVTGYLVTAIDGTTRGVSVAVTSDKRTATLTGLKGGTAYTFDVTPFNDYGRGARSSASAAVTPTGNATTYAATVIADGASAYLRYTERTGASIADSSSGGGLGTLKADPGTRSQPGLLAEDPDPAVQVRGSSEASWSVADAGLPTGAAPRSVEAWFRSLYTVSGSSVSSIAGWGSAATRKNFVLTLQGGTQAGIVTQGDDKYVTLPTRYDDFQWHHVVATYDGTTIVIYYDGVRVGTTAFSGTIATTTSGLRLSQPSYFNATIDEVAVYPTVLTDAQVANHRQVGRRTPDAPTNVRVSNMDGALVATWDLSTYSNGSPITGYVVRAANRLDGVVVQTVTCNATCTAINLPNLTNGTGYTVSVRAVNANGESPATTADGTPIPPMATGLPAGPNGPTMVTGNITTNTTWGPEASPYVLTSTTISNGVTLTMLPGTVVKFRPGALTAMAVYGQILALGTEDKPVVITSYKDDTVGGDTNSNGGADQAAMSDWASIELRDPGSNTGLVSVFDHVDVRYGGFDHHCIFDEGAIMSTGRGARMIVSNSRFTHNNGGVASVGSIPGKRSYAGVFNNYFSDNSCDVAPGDATDVFGNVMDGSSGTNIQLALNGHQDVRVSYNDLYAGLDNWDTDVPGSSDIDVSYNNIYGGGVKYFVHDEYPDQTAYDADLRFNWWGFPLGWDLGRCMSLTTEPLRIPYSLHPSTCSGTSYRNTDYSGWYTVWPGLDGPVSTHSPSAWAVGNAPTSGPVNLATGALTYSATDLSLNDAGESIDVTRTYRSDRAAGTGTGDLGDGWSLNNDETAQHAGTSNDVSFGDGSTLRFGADGSGGSGVPATMTIDGTGARALRTSDQSVYAFDANGMLSSVSLRGTGHDVHFDHSGRAITKITGVSGRDITLAHTSGLLTGVTDSAGRSLTYGYTSGRLTSADVLGSTGDETYSYDGSGRLTAVTTPLGRPRLTATYGTDGKVATYSVAGQGTYSIEYHPTDRYALVTRPDTTVVRVEYDSQQRVVDESITGGRKTHVVYGVGPAPAAVVEGIGSTGVAGSMPAAFVTCYDMRGRPTAEFDPAGVLTTTTYDTSDRPVKTTFGDEASFTRGYDGTGRVDQITDPNGHVWHATYNAFGEPLTTTDPLNRVTSNTYLTNGDPDTSVSIGGLVTEYGVDSAGRVTTVDDPLGHRTTRTYKAWDAVATVTNARNATTTLTYDDDHNVLTMLAPAHTAATTNTYDAYGRVATTTDPTGAVTTYAYDAMGRVSSVTDGRDNEWSRSYDVDGNVATTSDPLGHVTTLTYDSAGHLTSSTDPTGVVTVLGNDRAGRLLSTKVGAMNAETRTYDARGRLKTVAVPRGGTTTYSYDASGNRTTIVDSVRGTLATNTYDDANRLATATGRLGAVQTVAYDAEDRVTSVTDSFGIVARATYDDAGRVLTQGDAAGVHAFTYTNDGAVATDTDAEGRLTSYVTDLAGRVTTMTDGDGYDTTVTYDGLDRAVRVDHPDTTYETFTYDEAGNQVAHRDGSGAVWTAAFDDANRLYDQTDPLSHVTHHDYDNAGRETALTDADGVVTGTHYDTSGRVDYTSDMAGKRWTNTYTVDALPTATADPDGVTASTTYDAAGRMTESIDGAGKKTTYTRNAADQVLTATDPLSRVRAWSYDNRGRLTSEENGAVHGTFRERTEHGYDAANRRTSTTIRPSGRSWAFTYDDTGLLLTTSNPMVDGLGHHTETAAYSYNARGLLSSVTLPNGGVWTRTYDELGRLQEETPPTVATGLGATTFSYDGAGRPVEVERASGRTVTTTRDAAGRATATSDGNVTRTFGYTDAGRLESAAVGTASLSFDYDTRGLLTSYTDGGGVSAFAYTDAHRRSSAQVHGATAVTSTYDNRGLLKNLAGPVARTYTYDNAGQLTRLDYASTANATRNETFTYDGAGRLTQRQMKNGISTTQVLESVSYDDEGRIAGQTQTGTGRSSVTSTYAYDDASRVVQAVDATLNGSTVTTGYDWDLDSNLTGVTTQVGSAPATTATHEYNDADQRVSSGDGTTYEYDEDGNLTSVVPDGAVATDYEYDGFGDLAGADTPGGSVDYTRDALGRVSSRTAALATTTFAYDAGSRSQVEQSVSGGATTRLVRTPGDALVAAVNPTATYAAVSNAHGDLAALVNDSTAAVDTFATYDAFGTPTVTAGATALPFGFQGDYADPLTGLVDMGARAYSPALAAFTSLDSVLGDVANTSSLNRYLYGNGDPLGMFDPDGHFSLGKWAKSAISSVTSAFDTAVDTVVDTVTTVVDTVKSAVETVTNAAVATAHKVNDTAHRAARRVHDAATHTWATIRDHMPSAQTILHSALTSVSASG